MKHRRLQELDRSDFSIIEGDPDIRGWDVNLSSGHKVGEVAELIIDAQIRKVRYMIVDLKNEAGFNLKERKVLIPVGLAELDKEEDDVLLPNVKADHLHQLPVYNEDALTPEKEAEICKALGFESKGKPEAGADNDAQFYEHDYFNIDNLYKHRLSQLDEKKARKDDDGLKLWELRSRQGVERRERQESDTRRSEEVGEDARMEMARNRRQNYEKRRYSGDGRSSRGSIIDRIRTEGLQDANQHPRRD